MGYRHINNPDLMWLAGLLEGEGCFSYAVSPGIKVGMTDRDVVRKVSRLFGRGTRGPYKYASNRKPVYYTEIWAGPAIDLMMRLQPHMGARRRGRIRGIVAKWKRAPGKGHRRGIGATPLCHPRRKHYAFRMCRSCYRKSRWSKGEAR